MGRDDRRSYDSIAIDDKTRSAPEESCHVSLPRAVSGCEDIVCLLFGTARHVEAADTGGTHGAMNALRARERTPMMSHVLDVARSSPCGDYRRCTT
jgi:hypothetical protein